MARVQYNTEGEETYFTLEDLPDAGHHTPLGTVLSYYTGTNFVQFVAILDWPDNPGLGRVRYFRTAPQGAGWELWLVKWSFIGDELDWRNNELATDHYGKENNQ